MSASFLPNSTMLCTSGVIPGTSHLSAQASTAAQVLAGGAAPNVFPVLEQTAAAPGELPQICLPETVPVWGTDFARVNMPEVVEMADQIVRRRQPSYFVTANLNYLMLTDRNHRLRTVNREAAAVLADGYPIVLRSRCGVEPLPERVAGADLIVELAKLSAAKGHRIYFLGAAPGVADAAATELRRQFPKIQISGCYSPPFRQLSEEENQSMVKSIRDAKTDILLVAFGQPKGELWIHENYQQLGVPLSIQLGASFDFLAGTAQRAPQIVQQFGAEWLYRSILEPRRLAPRYAKNVLFLARALLYDLKQLLG